MGSIPALERSPGVRNGNPLQHSCLGNPMNRGAWQATGPWDLKELDTAEWLSTAHLKSLVFSFLLFDSTLSFFFLFSSVFLPQVLLLTVLTNWNKNNYFVCLFCGWMVFVLVDTLMNNTENIMGNKTGKTQWSPRNLFFLYCVFSSRFSLSFCVCYVIS